MAVIRDLVKLGFPWEGRPIGAHGFQMGPFVMNSAEELRQAVEDYRRTQFGGWPWSGPDPVHDRVEGRFASTPTGGSSTGIASASES
jgi:hypothetical protein